jgi:FkbM family methyltransferase
MKIQEWIKNNLNSNSIIIEAGAFDGSDTQFFCDFFPSSKIYSFEPVEELFNYCYQKLCHYNNLKLYKVALSSQTGFQSLFVSDLSGQIFASSSILKPKDHLEVHPSITFKVERIVESITLDDFCQKENIENVDFMWLDMQGAEPSVIQASLKTLTNTKFLYTEVSLIETYEGVMLYPDFKKLLIENNFEVVFEDLPHKDMGNVLFKNKNL